jgi:hypothetical protein
MVVHMKFQNALGIDSDSARGLGQSCVVVVDISRVGAPFDRRRVAAAYVFDVRNDCDIIRNYKALTVSHKLLLK